MKEEIEKHARALAEFSAGFEPAITEIYLFPSDDEIRLVALDPTTLPSENQLTAFYFPPDPKDGIPYPSAMALILPEEKDRVRLPETWGDWSDAVLIYRSKDLAA